MINSVRNTVLSILNKNNYGYISPSDFNLFAKQAQLEIFDEYFSKYNQSLNAENGRASGTEYADRTKAIEEAINVFSVSKFLKHSSLNKFSMPSLTTTGDNYYMINRVVCYTSELVSGNTDGSATNQIVDSTVDFTTLGIKVGDIASNTTDKVTTTVTGVSTNSLTVEDDVFVSGEGYVVYDSNKYVEAEKVNQSKITMLTNSLLTAPSTQFPAYTEEANVMSVFPSSIQKQGGVFSQYIRYPKDPKWTYVELIQGEPSFNASASDYQDFELPIEDEPLLVTKILQYAGLSIREAAVVQAASNEEIKSMQTQ